MNTLRRVAWTLGVPVRLAMIALIRVYRATLSGWLGGQCRFYPTCSHYAEEAIRTHGAVRGALLAVWRILRCGPFTEGGVDHVPEPHFQRYEDVIHGAEHSAKASP